MRDRHLVRVAWVVGSGLLVVACGDDVQCPGERVLQEDVCVCPVGSVEMGDECVVLDSGVAAARASDAAAPVKTPARGGEDAASPHAMGDADSWLDSARDSGLLGDASADIGNGPEAGRAPTSVEDAAATATVSDAATVATDGGDVVVPDAPPACVATMEVCDGKDNDCDGSTDEDVKETPIGESCSNGAPSACAMMGKKICFNGAIICSAPPPMPGIESCNGMDDDCDGAADDGLINACGGSTCGADVAKKGTACTAGQGECKSAGTLECDPAAGNNALRCSAVEKQKSSEICGNGKDEDCDGTADNGCMKNACGGWNALPHAVGEGCSVTVGACSYLGSYQCAAGDPSMVTCGGTPPAESCSTPADDNCDGVANEGCPPLCVGATQWFVDCDADGIPPLGAAIACGTATVPPAPQSPTCSAWTLTPPTQNPNPAAVVGTWGEWFDCNDHDPTVNNGPDMGWSLLQKDHNCDGRIDQSFWLQDDFGGRYQIPQCPAAEACWDDAGTPATCSSNLDDARFPHLQGTTKPGHVIRLCL